MVASKLYDKKPNFMLQSHDITISFINHAYLIYHCVYVCAICLWSREKRRKKYILAQRGFEPGATRVSTGALDHWATEAKLRFGVYFKFLNYTKIDQFLDGLQGQESA